MDGSTLPFSGGVGFPPKTHNTFHHTKPTIITSTMTAAAAPLWTPSEVFAPTILYPTMSLLTYFQDIPLGNFYSGWFSAGDRQPVVLDLGALTAIYAIMRG